MKKYVYMFPEGNGKMRELLGGKGANLAEMTGLGMPVPQGFTITTEACTRYYEDGKTIYPDIQDQILLYLLIYGIGEVGAGSGIGFLIVDIIQPDTFVYRIGVGHGFIVLCLTDKAKLQHFIQTGLTTFCIFFRMPDRIVFGWILGDAGNDRTFGNGQFTAVLTEVTQGSGFHTKSILS